jgi:hypothetical protein
VLFPIGRRAMAFVIKADRLGNGGTAGIPIKSKPDSAHPQFASSKMDMPGNRTWSGQRYRRGHV